MCVLCLMFVRTMFYFYFFFSSSIPPCISVIRLNILTTIRLSNKLLQYQNYVIRNLYKDLLEEYRNVVKLLNFKINKIYPFVHIYIERILNKKKNKKLKS